MNAADIPLRDFLSRWSRRKRACAAAAPEQSAPAPPRGTAREIAERDLDGLDFESSYSRFLAADVPSEISSKALLRLWTSSDIIARPDDLDDYLEDFSEAAMALTPERAKSAYRVGRGFTPDENAAESTDLLPPTDDTESVAGGHAEAAAGAHEGSETETPIEDDCHGHAQHSAKPD